MRRFRLARGVSQQDFAHEIEMDRTYYGGVERGERNVSIDNVERIAKGLEVSPWLLLKEPD
ncbi:helix-turn-helix domain-containing protein [Sphingopyxis chilensis]